jgi:hypothetical protein
MGSKKKTAYTHHSSTLKFDVRVDQQGKKKECLVLEECEAADAQVRFETVREKEKHISCNDIEKKKKTKERKRQ